MARVVAQRVRSASVSVDGEVIGAIGKGLVLLAGIREGDDAAAVDRVADKVSTLRIFEDASGRMNLSPADVGAAMLVVSQFTLYADLRKGRRPSFVRAASPDRGLPLCEHLAQRLTEHGFDVRQGRFGAHMVVALENDGPVTIIVDSDEL